MADDTPHIEIKYAGNFIKDQNTYDVDTGPLMLPKHIAIGKPGSSCGGGHNYLIQSYDNQVDEYAIWLEEQIKTGNRDVMLALEQVFQMAIHTGVVLTTVCLPSPYRTHAHVVRQTIMDIAAAQENQGE